MYDYGYSYGYGLIGGNTYNPLINYDWSTTTTSGLRYLKDVGSTPTYNASMYFGRGAYLNGVDQTITVPINATIQTALKRVNGIVTINETSQTLTNYVISGLGVHKDYYLFTRLLTTAEKDSYTNTPELFYAMAQADSTCVLNMPMCETDGYVRNMKSYSEGDNFSGFTISSETMGTGNSITKNNNTFNITNVVSTGQVYLPLVKFTPDVFNSDLYYQEIEVKCVTGTLKVRAIEGNPSTTINEVLTAGQSRVYTKVSGFANLGGQKGVIFLDGLNYPSFTAEVTLRNVRKITNGIQPIQNYTSSVRDNAKNLQYGLQTCKFVRDSLGVIQSASNYLECDGVGYADTGWKPSATEDWSIEIIKLLSTTGEYDSDGTLINNNTRVGLNNIGVYLYVDVGIKISGDGTHNLVPINGIYLITIIYTSSLHQVKVYFNGILKSTYINSFTTGISTFNIGRYIENKSKNNRRLFKVHNKELTQAEITANFNSYQNKGLLS